MGMGFATGQQFSSTELPLQKPSHQRIDEAIAAKGHKRRPLPDKPEVARPELRQSYKNRGGSNYRERYARMVGSE